MATPIVVQDGRIDTSKIRLRRLFQIPSNVADLRQVPGEERSIAVKLAAPAPPLNIILNWRPPPSK